VVSKPGSHSEHRLFDTVVQVTLSARQWRTALQTVHARPPYCAAHFPLAYVSAVHVYDSVDWAYPALQVATQVASRPVRVQFAAACDVRQNLLRSVASWHCGIAEPQSTSLHTGAPMPCTRA